jgi:polyisoprenoid-binding protein YceI
MNWTLDNNHSRVDFAVKHLAISTVHGTFRQFSGTAETDERGELESIEGRVTTTSVDTNSEQRDAHLRSPDFFDSQTHPEMTFRSTRIEKTGQAAYRVHGELTIRGTTAPVVFQMKTGEVVRDPWGNQRTAAELTARINRKEWGLTWNVALELGGVMVSDDVLITIEAQAIADRALAAA